MRILSVIIMILLPAFAFAQPSERTLTLEESISAGINNSPELLAFTEQIALAQQRVGEARASIYPKIDFNFSASRIENDLPLVLSPSFESTYLPQGVGQFYATRFTLWQYLYAAGRYTNNLRLAETSLSQARGQSEIVRNRVVRDTAKAFYSLIAARQRLKAIDGAMNALRSADGQDVQKNLAILTEEKRRMLYDVARAQMTFLDMIGAELTAEVELSGDLACPEETYDVNKAIAWAFQFRPELRQTQFQETIDSLRVNLSMAERYPTITMGANYEWQGEQFPLAKTNLTATVNLNVPVFDGWAAWARIKQRKFQAREGKIRRSYMEDQVRREVREAYMDYNFWQETARALKDVQPSGDPLKTRDEAFARIDVLLRALHSKADLDWATGRNLSPRMTTD